VTAAEPATEPHANHGEGPVWWAGWGGLRWVDMLAGDVLALEPAGVRRIHVGSVAAAIRPRRAGGMVVAVARGFALTGPDDEVRTLPEIWSDPSVRMNDGGCDPDGRFYCGTMAYDAAPGRGALYRLDLDGEASLVFDGVTISNGLAWSPDGGTAYYIDTPTQGVDAFDYDTERGLYGRRRLLSIPEELGAPDGMTVDAEGALWVAMHGGGAVLRFRPDGTADGRVEVPVRDVTACAFGGPELDRLFITTSRLGGDESPLAGALFRADVGVTGRPALPYGG
jgi:sugar lactone lactonase YvrE